MPDSDPTPPPAVSVNKLKSQVRSLERKLAKFKASMTAPQRTQTETALHALHAELERRTATAPSAPARNKRRKTHGYHRFKAVRFTERIKTVRRIKRIEKEKDSERLQEALLDLCYVMHFPDDQDYISLYPTPAHPADRQAQQARHKADLRAQIAAGRIDVDTLYKTWVRPSGPKKRTKGSRATAEAMAKKLVGKQLRGEFLPSDSESEGEAA